MQENGDQNLWWIFVNIHSYVDIILDGFTTMLMVGKQGRNQSSCRRCESGVLGSD